jgi:hypothetical protein
MPVAIKTVDFQAATNLINESGLNSLQGRIAETIAAQREQCAKIAETCGVEGDNWRRDIAAAIRNLKSE